MVVEMEELAMEHRACVLAGICSGRGSGRARQVLRCREF